MGSRILSRSFHVEQWAGEEGEEEQNGGGDADVSMESRRSMDVDRSREENSAQIPHEGEEHAHEEGDGAEDGNSDSDDEDQENVEDVAMVPMADMLNARYGGENVSTPNFCLTSWSA